MKFLVLFFTVLVMCSQANANTAVKLALCANTPNCVSSQANPLDKRHYIQPFTIVGKPAAAWLALRTTLKKHDRTVITHETDTTLHAEAISLVFSFIDDIDIILDTDAGLIHLRSASRVGHSDFGVNRKRIEKLREELRKMNVIS